MILIAYYYNTIRSSALEVEQSKIKVKSPK